MDEDLPTVVPEELGEPRADVATAAVLLAAGTSSGYGAPNKLLVDVDGAPMVRRAAETLLAADVGLERVVAVVGHGADAVRAALADLPIEVVENPAYRAGQATSVVAGVEAVAGCDAALFALGDMPFVAPRSVALLVEAHAAGAGSALAAAYEGRRGNPVLFDAEHFAALRATSGDTGGRAVLLGSDDAALVETGDPGVLRDVDAPGDLQPRE